MVEIKGYDLDVDPKDKNGKPWSGVINSDGKYLDTISFVIQPGGGGGWAYELTDYRLSIKNSGGKAAYWTEYANQFIKVGNPLAPKTTKECTPSFCLKVGDPACEPLSSSYPREDADWVVLMCGGTIGPVESKYKCDEGQCQHDPIGTLSKEQCQQDCKAPPPSSPKCKDIDEGAEHDYCSGWCNKEHVWENCGDNKMNDGTMCSCSGCSGCPSA